MCRPRRFNACTASMAPEIGHCPLVHNALQIEKNASDHVPLSFNGRFARNGLAQRLLESFT
jgi:hypothetical protein